MPFDAESTERDILLVHSSDLHVDDDRVAAMHGGDGAAGLRGVLETARDLGADIVILAGDTFDNHQVTTATIDRAGMLLADAGLPVVVLPGNHDPATPDSIWLRGRFDEIGNVAIIGITNQRKVAFPALDLEIWGNAHRDYHDMVPLRDPPPRAARWHIAVGHGHYEPPETWANPLRPSWLISDAMIRETRVRLRRARPLGPRRAGRVRRRAGLLLGRAASRRDRQCGSARSDGEVGVTRERLR